MLMGLSGQLLNSIYPYSDPGGMFVGKIHPASFIVLVGVILLVVQQGFVRTIHEYTHRQLWVLQFVGTITLIAIINVIRFGTGGAAYLVDTFLTAAFTLLLVERLLTEERYRIAELILLFVFFNSLLTIAELLFRTNLIPHHNEIGAAYFRAAGVFGHPLTNGLVTAPLLPLLLLTKWSRLKKAVVAAAYMLSILASGARGALIIGVPIFLSALSLGMVEKLWRGRLRSDIGTAIPWAVMMGIGLFAYLLTETSFGARFMERGLHDENATVRINAFNLLSYLSADELWRGIDTSYYQFLISKYPDLEIIENFWINLLVSFGVPIFIIFVVSFTCFFLGLRKGCGVEATLAIVSFMLVASTNNSLSTKCAALTIFVIVAYGLSRPAPYSQLRVRYPVRFARFSKAVKNA
jgi:hypothetical protein